MNRITSDKYKAISIINSCNTLDQTNVAEKFCRLYLHRYNTDIGVDHYYDLLTLIVKKRGVLKIA